MRKTLVRRIALIGGLLLFTLHWARGLRVGGGLPLFDAFYMTLVTISTVGYERFIRWRARAAFSTRF